MRSDRSVPRCLAEGGVELRRGDWRKVINPAPLAPFDQLITDPPFSARTHRGQTATRRNTNAARAFLSSIGLPYPPMTPELVEHFVDVWAPCVRQWMCIFTSHDLIPTWEAALRRHARYVFAPIACVVPGSNVRLVGDGPSNWSTWMVRSLIVARPRSMRPLWGTLPGAYVVPRERLPKGTKRVPGEKPLGLMRAIVRDYSRPGDVVVDPFAGRGTTLRACQLEGRNALGAEIDRDRYTLAASRLREEIAA